MGIPHDMPVNLYVIRGVDTAVNVYPSIRFAFVFFVSFHNIRFSLIANTFIQVCCQTSNWGLEARKQSKRK